MNKITALLCLAFVMGCAHGMSSGIDKFDENTPKDYDPEAYNQAYEQRHEERKKEDPRFEQFRKRLIESSNPDDTK